MNKIFTIILIITCHTSFAQIPEDAVRYSWYPHNGSARYMAIGGVMGSLGGDISATFVNPAGLGFYRTRELVFTPGVTLNRSNFNYRDSLNKEKNNNFLLGPIGVVIGHTSRFDKKFSSAWSLAINQTANFNNVINYRGLNNYSSFSEQFVEEFVKSGYSIDDVLQTQSPLPFTSAPALYTYLIDTVRVNGVVQVKGAPEYLLDAGGAVYQEMNKRTRGGLYELALGGAVNDNDKYLLGATLGVPLVYYKSETRFSESDTSANTFNNFKSFTYSDNYESVGAGLNLKLGFIYRPKDYIRLGIAVHSPSVIWLTDTHSSELRTTVENSSGLEESFNVSSNNFTNSAPGENEYIQITPWKAMISGSYVFREVQDVTRQKGFISADIEYVNHAGSRFRSSSEEPDAIEKNYYKQLGRVVKDYYKSAFNFRVGGELKFNTIMTRLGFAYYSNPHRNAGFKANRMLLSGGLGYRNKGFFADLTYVHSLNKNADFPYRLEDRANTFATVKQTQGNIIATIGFKF